MSFFRNFREFNLAEVTIISKDFAILKDYSGSTIDCVDISFIDFIKWLYENSLTLKTYPRAKSNLDLPIRVYGATQATKVIPIPIAGNWLSTKIIIYDVMEL